MFSLKFILLEMELLVIDLPPVESREPLCDFLKDILTEGMPTLCPLLLCFIPNYLEGELLLFCLYSYYCHYGLASADPMDELCA